MSAVLADRAADAAALIDAGFALSQDTRQAIRLKAIRSGEWRLNARGRPTRRGPAP